MTLTIILLPLITFLILISLSFTLGRDGKYLAIILPTISLIESFYYIYQHSYTTTLLVLGNWISVSHLNILWTIIFSPFTLTTATLILFLSIIIQIYSLNYMDSDLNIILFLAYMNLFSFFMIWFIYTNNLVLNLIGWEGIGLLSYLLINFWTLRIESNKASLKAIFINKIGDLFFLISIILIFNIFLTTNTTPINVLAIYFKNELILFNINMLTVITLFLIIAGLTKSAQLILNLWLPDAMEGPTPVSSLIHSATMVAAGFLLLIKYNGLIEQTYVVLPLLFLIGFLTSIISSFESICLYDHKSVLAGSTCEQLGMLFSIYGCGNLDLAFFHFYTHAFYKSLLFLSLGALIHQTGEQDSRFLTILTVQTPLVISTYQVALFALLGFPAFISHYSKAIIINTFYIQSYGLTNYVWLLTQFSQLLTSLNTLLGSFGLYFLYDSLSKRKQLLNNKHIYQSSFIKLPLIVLTLIVLIGGLILSYINKYSWFIENNSQLKVNYWLNSYFIPSYSLLLNILILSLSFFITYLFIYYNLINKTKKFQYSNFIQHLLLNFSIDKLFNLVSLNYAFWSYDIYYLALNNSLFNLNFYLRYILYFNYYHIAISLNLKQTWLISNFIIFTILFFIILI